MLFCRNAWVKASASVLVRDWKLHCEGCCETISFSLTQTSKIVKKKNVNVFFQQITKFRRSGGETFLHHLVALNILIYICSPQHQESSQNHEEPWLEQVFLLKKDKTCVTQNFINSLKPLYTVHLMQDFCISDVCLYKAVNVSCFDKMFHSTNMNPNSQSQSPTKQHALHKTKKLFISSYCYLN